MRKTILVIVDACGYDMATEYFGYLEHLADYDQCAKYKVQGELPSISKPMYETLMTGTPTYVHGIVSNEVSRMSHEKSVFELCHEAGLKTGAAAWYWISELYNEAPFIRERDRIRFDREGDRVDYGIYYWEDEYPDSVLFAEGEYIRLNYAPDFMLYLPMSVDNAGHLYHAGSTAYAQRVAEAGIRIAALIPEWLKAGYQVVVTADHGMDANGIHCGTSKMQTEVPLYIISPKVYKGRFEEEAVSQRNIAPLLCRLMEIEPSEAMIDPVQISFKDQEA